MHTNEAISKDFFPVLKFKSSDDVIFKVPSFLASASKLWSAMIQLNSTSNTTEDQQSVDIGVQSDLIQLSESSTLLKPLFFHLDPANLEVVSPVLGLRLLELADKYEILSIARMVEHSFLVHEASGELSKDGLEQDQLFKLFNLSTAFDLKMLKDCSTRLILGLSNLSQIKANELSENINERELNIFKSLQEEWDQKRRNLVDSLPRKTHSAGYWSHSGGSTSYSTSEHQVKTDLKDARIPLSKVDFLDKITGSNVGYMGGCPSCGHLTACNMMHLHSKVLEEYLKVEFPEDELLR